MGKTCYKITYNTHADANQALIGSRSRRKKGKASKGRKEVAAYQCDNCGLWHLTSNRKKKR